MSTKNLVDTMLLHTVYWFNSRSLDDYTELHPTVGYANW